MLSIGCVSLQQVSALHPKRHAHRQKQTRTSLCTQEEKSSSFLIVRIHPVIFTQKHARIKIQCMYTHIRTWTYSNESLHCACMWAYVCVVGVYTSGSLTFEESSLSDSK